MLAIKRVFGEFQAQAGAEGSAEKGSRLEESAPAYVAKSGKSDNERLGAILELVKNQNEY